jgi:hypothetical protein
VTERGTVLSDGAFVGIQVEYDWWLSEGAENDYDAGFQALDDDLAAVAGAGKKLVIFLQYKNFTQGGNAVPAYLRDAGPWCETLSSGQECGQYDMNNGVIAMIWQGLGTGGVADRIHAWIDATGAHALQSQYASSVAGIVFPESACGDCQADPLYSQAGYLTALEDDVAAAGGAFPGAPVFQYINNLSGPNPDQEYLYEYAQWAAQTPYAGAGCPDVAPSPYPNPGPAASLGCNTGSLPKPFGVGEPPGYSVLIDAGVQGTIPFNVAIESPDYTLCRTASLQDTWDVAMLPAASGGMAAQYIVWINHSKQGATDAFALPDVINWIEDAGTFPNAAPPTW